MTARRTLVLAALTVLTCALPAGTASAAGAGQITSPAADAVLAGRTAIVVEVTGDTQRTDLFDPPPSHDVQVRLAAPSGDRAMAGTDPVSMTCETDCHSTSTWTAPDLDPASLAPFASTASCNGAYTIQVRVDGGGWSGHGIRVARAPAAPRDVSATAEVGEATVSWQAAADPDVVGYRVQRRVDGSWTTVATRPAAARSVTDTDVGPGEVEYRVATLKGDGRVDGEPVAPCADTEPDLSTASVPVRTTVPSASGGDPTPAPSSTASDPSGTARPTPSSGTGPTDGGSQGATDGADGADGGTTAGDPDDPAAGEPSGAPDAGSQDAQPAPPRSGNRVAPPTAVDVGNRSDVTVADLPAGNDPQVADERESYYGDGEEFSEELDFGGLGGVEAAGPAPGTQVVRIPGALQSILGQELDLRRLAAPMAAGLVMVALALHLRRWMRAGMEPQA